MEYEILSDQVELNDEKEGTVVLSERHYFKDGKKIIEYKTEGEDGNIRHWEAIKDPELLTDEERHEILDYALGKGGYQADEIVNYYDLFMHSKFVVEIK